MTREDKLRLLTRSILSCGDVKIKSVQLLAERAQIHVVHRLQPAKWMKVTVSLELLDAASDDADWPLGEPSDRGTSEELTAAIHEIKQMSEHAAEAKKSLERAQRHLVEIHVGKGEQS